MSPSPWFELTHPWGTDLNDFELHILVVPIPIGATNQIANFEIGRFKVAERDVLIAVCQDAIEMLLDHTGKAVVRFQAAPFELGHPAIEELPSPCL